MSEQNNLKPHQMSRIPLIALICLFSLNGLANPLKLPIEPVAPGVISTDMGEYSPTFDVNNNQLVFMRRTPGRLDYTLYTSTFQNDQWTHPEIVPFSGKWRDAGPSFSPDGQTLVFDSNRPHPEWVGGSINLWQVKRTDQGWEEAEPLLLASTNRSDEPSTGVDEYGPLITSDGTVWFYSFRQPHRGGIHYRTLANAGPTTMPEMPDPSANTFVGYLTLSADGQTAVIEGRNRQGRDTDLFYACLQDGSWTAPQPLEMINSTVNDGTPYLTSDGHWLWFASEQNNEQPNTSNLYRINTQYLPIPCE